MMEAWRTAVGWEDWYEVSNLGRVRSLPRMSIAGGYPARYKGRVLTSRAGKNGYHVVCFTSPWKKRECRYVHQLVCEMFLGVCPPGLEVCHNDGTRDNNTVSNLRYDTRSANSLDRHIHGTMPKHNRCGSSNGCAVLDEDKVIFIRTQTQLSVKQLAERFNVHFGTIYLILANKTWKHVPWPDSLDLI